MHDRRWKKLAAEVPRIGLFANDCGERPLSIFYIANFVRDCRDRFILMGLVNKPLIRF